MNRMRLALMLGATFGLLGFGATGQAQDKKGSLPGQPERKDELPPLALAGKPAAGFPRTDGVYRFARRTTLIGFANPEIYDYVAFTPGGDAYFIVGHYDARDSFGLVQPDEKLPGAFSVHTAALRDQTAYIKKWVSGVLADKPGRSGKYTVKDGAVSFTVALSETGGQPLEPLLFHGRAAGDAIKFDSTWLRRRMARETGQAFQFELFKP